MLVTIDVDRLIDQNEHIKAWRWHLFTRGLTVDRNGLWWDNRGNRIDKRSW